MRKRWGLAIGVAAAAAAWAAARRAGAFRIAVAGDSMVPALEPGQFVMATRPQRLHRGDVVVVRRPERPVDIVKRLIGLPGDRLEVRDGVVEVNGQLVVEPYARGTGPPGSWELGDDEFLVLGDKRDRSSDGRAFGPVPRSAIVGVVRFRYWPRAGRVR